MFKVTHTNNRLMIIWFTWYSFPKQIIDSTMPVTTHYCQNFPFYMLIIDRAYYVITLAGWRSPVKCSNSNSNNFHPILFRLFDNVSERTQPDSITSQITIYIRGLWLSD